MFARATAVQRRISPGTYAPNSLDMPPGIALMIEPEADDRLANDAVYFGIEPVATMAATENIAPRKPPIGIDVSHLFLMQSG